jgi:hypothetical protein
MASGDAHASCRALTKTRSSPSSSARSMVCPLRTNTSRRHVTRASVDLSGRRLRRTARADRRSVRSGLTPDNTALRRGRAMLPGSARTAAVGSKGGQQLRHAGSCLDGPGRGLRNPSREPAGHDPRRTPLMPAAPGCRMGGFPAASRRTSRGLPGGSTWCGRSPRPTRTTAHPSVRRTSPRPRTAVPASASRRGAGG